MTCREKLMREHPDMIYPTAIAGCEGCPSNYGYLPNPSYCQFNEKRVEHGGIECIDAMESAFGIEAVQNFCACNAFKYIFRFLHKNGLEDVDKAVWYLNKYKELEAKKNG